MICLMVDLMVTELYEISEKLGVLNRGRLVVTQYTNFHSRGSASSYLVLFPGSSRLDVMF